MPPLISVVGKSKSGKTTLLEKLVPELRRRGCRVAVIKHSAHGFDLDREGTDSDRLLRAGGGVVALVSPHQFVLLQHREQELSLRQVPRWLADSFDVVLAEGFSRQKATKIETHRPELGADLLCPPSELWAVVSDAPLDLSLPRFSWEDTAGLANFILNTFPQAESPELELFVNGLPVNTKPFVADIMSRTVAAMVSTLKGVGEIKEVDVRVRWRG